MKINGVSKEPSYGQFNLTNHHIIISETESLTQQQPVNINNFEL